MLSNKQKEKYLSKLKKEKFTKIDECKNILLVLLNEDCDMTLDFIKSSLFFKCIGKELEQIIILKNYYDYLYQISKANGFIMLKKYLKNIFIIFSLYKKFNNQLKKLSKFMSFYLYRNDYEKIIEKIFGYIGLLYYKKNGYIRSENTIDYIKYVFKYLNNRPLKSIRRIGVLDIFNILNLLSEIEKLEYMQLLFGAKIKKKFDGLLLCLNRERVVFEITNRRKIINIDYEHNNILKIIKEMDLDQIAEYLGIINTIKMMVHNTIPDYIDFYNRYNHKIINMIDRDVFFESLRLGMKVNDFINIEIFKSIKVKDIIKIFSFFYFYSSEFDTKNIGERISYLLRKKFDFLSFLIKLLKISRTKAVEIFNLLSSSVESYIDASYTPILVINETLYFNSKVLSSNNISRNLICMLYKSSSSKFNNNSREIFMLGYLIELFENNFPPQKIYKNINYKYMKDKISYEGDIDLILEYEQDVYIFECKSILNIVEYYEYMRVANQLKKAEIQLTKIKDWITVHNNSSKKIHYAVISTTKLLLGNRFISYPVVSFEDIYNFLENKRIILPSYYIRLDSINNDDFNRLIYDYWYEKFIYNASLYKGKSIEVLYNEEQIYFNYFKFNHICKKQKNFIKYTYAKEKTNFLSYIIVFVKLLFMKKYKF